MAIALSSCERQVINGDDKLIASNLLDESKPVVFNWINEFDTNGTEHLANIKMVDYSTKRLTDNSKQRLIQKINNQFGVLDKRDLIGAHIWTGDKLVSWVENPREEILERLKLQQSDDGFYNIDPKYFGFLRSSDMVRGYPKGQYVIFMFSVLPSKINYAEEAITLWKNKKGEWLVVNYRIAEDI